jgi:hypothetical protein
MGKESPTKILLIEKRPFIHAKYTEISTAQTPENRSIAMNSKARLLSI